MEGFRIGEKDSFLETVVYDFTKFSLLARGGGAEVILQTIGGDKLFYLYPSDNPEAFEFYYILSGEVICEIGDEKKILGPNDYFSIKGIKDPIHFTTKTAVTLLSMVTEPNFVHISNEILSLMEVVKQVEKKDRYTFNHSERVSKYSVQIAKKLKLSNGQLDNLVHASILHDIGKINVPEEILNKPGRLTKEEFDVIKKHPGDGAEMIKGTSYDDLYPIIEQHHERLNGSGYPHGLVGEEILLEARIIAVADTFDAMTEDRAYRKAFAADFAMDEITRLSGIQYDPEVVKAFEQVLKEEGIIS